MEVTHQELFRCTALTGNSRTHPYPSITSIMFSCPLAPLDSQQKRKKERKNERTKERKKERKGVVIWTTCEAHSRIDPSIDHLLLLLWPQTNNTNPICSIISNHGNFQMPCTCSSSYHMPKLVLKRNPARKF
jgi:hypothetical protein